MTSSINMTRLFLGISDFPRTGSHTVELIIDPGWYTIRILLGLNQSCDQLGIRQLQFTLTDDDVVAEARRLIPIGDRTRLTRKCFSRQ